MKKLICTLTAFILMLSVSASASELYFLNEREISGVSEPYKSFYGISEISNFGEYAIINKYGDIVVDFSSSPKKVAPNGLIAILGENNKIGFADQKGNMITDFEYDSFTDVHEKTDNVNVGYLSHMHLKGDGSSDLIPVSKDGKFGYINSYGTLVIPFKYDYAYGFVDGVARICADGVLSDYGTYTNGKYGYLREDGTELVPPDSYWIGFDYDEDLGYAKASNGGEHSVLINKNGKVIECDEKGYADVNANYIIVQHGLLNNGEKDLFSVLAGNGDLVIPPEVTEPITVNDNRFVVANTIRNENNEIIYSAPESTNLFFQLGKEDELIFTSYAPDGFFGVKKYGCVNWDGTVIFESEYDSISLIGDGLLRLKKDGEYILASDYGRVLFKSSLKPCIGYDGFVTLYDDIENTVYFAFNPLKRPSVYLDDNKISFTDAYPYFEGERTMIPLRSVFEDAGATVNWDGETGLISVTRGDVTVSMKIGDRKITVGDKIYESDRAPVAIDNRTYIPLRVFSEGIGMEVIWDGSTNSVHLKK